MSTVSTAMLAVEVDENMRLLFIAFLQEAERQEASGNAELADKLEQFTYDVIVPTWEQAVNLLK